MAKKLKNETMKFINAGALVRVQAAPLEQREDEGMELIPVPDYKHEWEYVGESGKNGFLFRCLGALDDDDEDDDD